MPEKDAEWTGRWVATRLQKHSEVQDVELLTPQVLRVVRKNLKPFVAGTIASSRVEASALDQLLNNSFEIEFVANIAGESFWTGEAIELVSRNSAAFGGMGDLYSATSLPNARQYVNKEFDFVERGLRQHTNVSRIERVHDRKYVVKRVKHKDLKVVLLNEYELTADHVRTARDRYGDFTEILITNPNGRPTSSAEQAAKSMGVSIYKWSELYGRLNKR